MRVIFFLKKTLCTTVSTINSVQIYLRQYVQKLILTMDISKQLASFLTFIKIMMCFKSQKTNAIFQLTQQIGWFLAEKREEMT